MNPKVKIKIKSEDTLVLLLQMRATPSVDRRSSRPKELPAERLDELMISRDTPFGRLRYLAPAAKLTATPGGWDLPTPLPDQDDPSWPDGPAPARQPA